MPFDRPSLADLESALQAEITSRIPGTDPKLRNSYLGSSRAVDGRRGA